MTSKRNVLLTIVVSVITFFLGSTVDINRTAPPRHDVTHWHEPAEGHHHGANPRNTPYYDAYMDAANQEIAYPWVSSVTENLYPFPEGKHDGFKYLSETNLNCEQANQSDLGYNCINGYLLLVHTLGTVDAIYTRVHSQYGVFEVCDDTQCGLVATGGHADYGVMHNGYKRAICSLPSDPIDYPYDSSAGLNHPPYRAAVNTTLLPLRNPDQNIQFWNTMGPGVNQSQYYPENPNNMLRLSWSSIDAWNYIDGAHCSDRSLAISPCPNGDCDLNHTLFQVFSIRLQNLPDERPFNGYTNVNGHVDPDCVAPSNVCVPLLIEATVPQGDALLARGVRQGKCDVIPCQEFDDGTPLYLPGTNGN